MRVRTSFILLSGLFAILVISAVHGQVPPRGSGWMPVTGFVRMIETDTLEVEVDGRRMGLAIAGIVGPGGNTECGVEGIIFAQELVNPGIELQEDLGVPTLDTRLRRAYRVSLSTGRSLAEELVASGYAWPDPRARGALEYQSLVGAAADASAGQRGCVWRLPPPK